MLALLGFSLICPAAASESPLVTLHKPSEILLQLPCHPFSASRFNQYIACCPNDAQPLVVSFVGQIDAMAVWPLSWTVGQATPDRYGLFVKHYSYDLLMCSAEELDDPCFPSLATSRSRKPKTPSACRMIWLRTKITGLIWAVREELLLEGLELRVRPGAVGLAGDYDSGQAEVAGVGAAPLGRVHNIVAGFVHVHSIAG